MERSGNKLETNWKNREKLNVHHYDDQEHPGQVARRRPSHQRLSACDNLFMSALRIVVITQHEVVLFNNMKSSFHQRTSGCDHLFM